MDKDKFKNILIDISSNLNKVKYEQGDLSDVGNEIGIVIGKYVDKELGYELDDFIHGIYHGISLTKDTHD